MDLGKLEGVTLFNEGSMCRIDMGKAHRESLPYWIQKTLSVIDFSQGLITGVGFKTSGGRYYYVNMEKVAHEE